MNKSDFYQDTISNKRRILHIDINSYFATLLQQENPHLRGKSIGVVKEQGRTCIIAASKEAKKLGIKTAMTVGDARVKNPDIILVPAAFELYLHATRTLKNLFESSAPKVEIFSLDEAFLDITNCEKVYKNSRLFGIMMQNKIKEALGSWVTCNVGISYNRFLAKLASEVSPKGSVVEITRENKDAYLAGTPFESICGVGTRLEKKLRAIGITNAYVIHFYSDEELCAQVGPYWVQNLRKIADGEEPDLFLHINKNTHMKTVGRSMTGYHLCDDEEEIKTILYNLILEIAHKARQMGLAGRQVFLAFAGEGQCWSAHETSTYYINRSKDIFSIAYHRLYKNWNRSFRIIKFIVRLGLLTQVEKTPSHLFPCWWKEEQTANAVDKVNAKYGLYTLYPATLLKKNIIKPEVTGFLGDKLFYLE